MYYFYFHAVPFPDMLNITKRMIMVKDMNQVMATCSGNVHVIYHVSTLYKENTPISLFSCACFHKSCLCKTWETLYSKWSFEMLQRETKMLCSGIKASKSVRLAPPTSPSAPSLLHRGGWCSMCGCREKPLQYFPSKPYLHLAFSGRLAAHRKFIQKNETGNSWQIQRDEIHASEKSIRNA